MFRFSIRELFLITAVVALVVGWWVEHRGKTTATGEAAYQEWKNRVLEVSLTGRGYKVKTEGKSITLSGEGGTTTITPTSLEHSDGKGGFSNAVFSKNKNGDPLPASHFPPRPSQPASWS